MFAGDRNWLVFGAVDDLFARLDAFYSNRRRLIRSVTWHLAGWFVGAIEVWVVLNFMGYQVDFGDAVIIESLMHAVRGAAFAVPGALGAQEGGLDRAVRDLRRAAGSGVGAVAGQAHSRSGASACRASWPGRPWRAGIFTAPAAGGRQSERTGLSGHDRTTFCWSRCWLAGAFGCLFMLVAAALMLVRRRGRSRRRRSGAGGDDPQAAARR